MISYAFFRDPALPELDAGKVLRGLRIGLPDLADVLESVTMTTQASPHVIFVRATRELSPEKRDRIDTVIRSL